MADDKKNIPDAGKVDEPPKPEKVEPVKADFPVQDQPAPAKAEAPVTEDASKVLTPPTAEKPIEGKTAPDPAAEQPALGGKEAPKDKDALAPSKEGAPQPGKDEKQTTIPGMGDPTPAGKVVDFTAARVPKSVQAFLSKIFKISFFLQNPLTFLTDTSKIKTRSIHETFPRQHSS